MPPFNTYKNRLGSLTNGQAHKIESDKIMEFTWDNDLESKVAYFYDYYLDDEPLKIYNLNSQMSNTKVPINIKFIVAAHNSDSKDQVSYKIQFKPSFRYEDDYRLEFYKDRFVEKYSTEWPIGLWCDIPDEKGNYRKWLITDEADWLDNQFPTWYVLPADHIFQWISDNKKYQMAGVSRSQNSYNSGIWQSRGGAVQTTTPENQKICILPMNEVSSTIFYDQRIVISSVIKTPITWQVSKVENMNPPGTNILTFSQSRWNEHTDAFEYEHEDGKDDFSPFYDSSRKVIGMYADYFKSEITPVEPQKEPTQNIHGEITYSGQPQIKVGGSYKKFTLQFYKDNELLSMMPDNNWEYLIDGVDCSNLFLVIPEDNTIKVKFNNAIGDESYIGSVLTLRNITNNITTSIDIEIVGL